MNPDRQIRFLYPPVLILAYLLWAVFEDVTSKRTFLCLLHSIPEVLKGNLAGLIGGSSAILIVGFVSGTATFLTLRLVFFLAGRRTHEVALSNALRSRVWTATMPSPSVDHSKILFATAYVHFGLCPKEVADWIARRWNAFNLSANICFGIAAVMGVVGWSHVIQPASYCWYYVGLGSLVGFFLNAVFAWNDTVGMVSFCAGIHRVEHPWPAL